MSPRLNGPQAGRPDGAAASGAMEELSRLAGPVFTGWQDSGLAMVATNPRLIDNPIAFANQAFLDLTGYPAAELLGRNCRMLQGPRSDQATILRISAALRAGSRSEFEILNYRKDGTAFWNRMFIAPIRDETGTIAFFLSSQIDVTAEIDARAAAADRQGQTATQDKIGDLLQRSLTMTGDAAAWEWQIPERKLFGDAGFAALYGLAHKSVARGVSPQTFFARIHPDDLPRVRLSAGAMLRGAEVFSKSFRILTESGGARWVHGRGHCTFDERGNPWRFSGVMVDITEQKRLEDRLRIAQSAGGIGTFEYVEGFPTVSVSDQFCRLLGLHEADNLPVRTINALVVAGDPPIIDVGHQPAAGRIELRIRRADTGEQRWLARRGEHVDGWRSAGRSFSGAIYDITDAKLTEARLRTLNETLEARVAERTRERDRIWQVSQDLLGVADLEGIWCSVNPAWTTLLGWQPGEIVGKSLAWLLHPDDAAARDQEPAALARMFSEAAAAGPTLAVTNRLCRRGGGYRWLAWTAVPEQGFFYCVGRDVTNERETEEALRQAEEKLRQSQKMEAVGQLTGGLAHDFNNLLIGIGGSLELMQGRIAEGRVDEIGRYIEAAQSAARRAASLTHRLLAFSRQQMLDPCHTDCNRLVAGMEDMIRRTMGPSITVEVEAEVPLWAALVDPNQLENALLNLCINGRDAMPDGGRLVIATENTRMDKVAAQAFDLPPGDYVTLSVADDGTGMRPEVMARAFDPFFTTKPPGQGTGLGLSMIYGFVRQSGGHVRISSVVGQGTVVAIHLPRQPDRQGAARALPEDPDQAGEGRGEAILLVDDEPTVRMLLTDALRDFGYRPLVAADGAQAAQILRSDAPIDLLITDIGLPGDLNGRRLADLARAARPNLKVLFITGYADVGLFEPDGLPEGMQVLTKPFAMDALATRIRTMMERPRTTD